MKGYTNMMVRLTAVLAPLAIGAGHALAHSSLATHAHPHAHSDLLAIDAVAIAGIALLAAAVLWRPVALIVRQHLARRTS